MLKKYKDFILENVKRIICSKCKWSWKLSEGGKEPYLCHKCGKDNTKKYTV